MYCTLQLGTTLVTLRGTTLVTLRYPNIRANASLLRLPVLQRLVIEFLEVVEFASRTSPNAVYHVLEFASSYSRVRAFLNDILYERSGSPCCVTTAGAHKVRIYVERPIERVLLKVPKPEPKTKTSIEREWTATRSTHILGAQQARETETDTIKLCPTSASRWNIPNNSPYIPGRDNSNCWC
jgi:hypothetical protein